MALYTSTIPGISEADIASMFSLVNENLYRHHGAGSNTSLYQTSLTGIDRFAYRPLLLNHEVAGLTFITRPKLNFTSPSLNMDPILASLNTMEYNSFPFAIRCLLDTKFSRSSQVIGAAEACPFFNHLLPFQIPLSNFLQSISGFPDRTLDTFTTEGGFFCESQTMVAGDDQLARNYELTLTFREIQGGFIMAIFLYWLHFMGLVTRGVTIAYPEDIDARRLCYTVSIYRFVLDPSLRYITKWAKATGCFPKSVPIGNAFNFADRESYLSATNQFSITFSANNIEYMNPIVFQEFNRLVARYAGGPTWRDRRTATDPRKASSNFIGIPYIDCYRPDARNEIIFYADERELQDDSQLAITDMVTRVKDAVARQMQQLSTTA